MKATTEKAFEAYIQEVLSARGWITGSNQLWDKEKALFSDHAISFIKETQGDLWAQMKKLHGFELSAKLIDTLIKERDTKGTLYIIRTGSSFMEKLSSWPILNPPTVWLRKP
jgi:type I restriction enzyme R subunit